MTTTPDILTAPTRDDGVAVPPRRSKAALASVAPPAAGRRRLDVPLLFVAMYIGFQVALLVLGSTPVRAPLRIGAFSLSLGLAVVVWPGRHRHPTVRLLPLVALALVPGLFMPGQPSILAAIAQATLYLSTLSPLLWASHRPIGQRSLRRILLLLWAFNSLSAAVGVLQVYYPGKFESQLSSVVAEHGAAFVGSLRITLADGSVTLRPMGLTDNPGGAAIGGLYAILFGLGILFTERRWAMRALALAGMVLGLFVIYLTHVRVTLVMAGIGMAVVGVAFARRGDIRRASSLVVVAVLVAVAGTVWAFTVGGEDTVKRFSSLTESDASTVYSENRGYFLSDAFTVLPFTFPLGAGAGRWGMISYYFGDPKAEALWAEIMWQSWIYDGGLPLLGLYTVVIAMTVWAAWRMATTRGGSGYMAVWGAVVLAYNTAAVAATFDSPIFATQAGLELWFLNACVFNAWQTARRDAGGGRPAAERLAGGAAGEPQAGVGAGVPA